MSNLGSGSSGLCWAYSTSVHRTSHRIAAFRKRAFSKAEEPEGPRGCDPMGQILGEVATDECLLFCVNDRASEGIRGDWAALL